MSLVFIFTSGPNMDTQFNEWTHHKLLTYFFGHPFAALTSLGTITFYDTMQLK